MSSKRIMFLAFSVLFLSNTINIKALYDLDDVKRFATIAIGVGVAAGGTHLMVKNPKKKEGIICRTTRTVFGAGMIFAGLGLVVENEEILSHIKIHGYRHFLHHVAGLVGLDKITGYIFRIPTQQA